MRPTDEQLDNHIPSYFLVACTRLYKPLCRLVSWSVAVHKARNLWRLVLFSLDIIYLHNKLFQTKRRCLKALVLDAVSCNF